MKVTVIPLAISGLAALVNAATISEMTLQLIDKTYDQVDLHDIFVTNDALGQMLDNIASLQPYVADANYNTSWPISRFQERLEKAIPFALSYARNISTPEEARKTREHAYEASAAFTYTHWHFGEAAAPDGLQLGGVQSYGLLVALMNMFVTEEIFAKLVFDPEWASVTLYYHNLYLFRALDQYSSDGPADGTGVESTFSERLQTWAGGLWRVRTQERVKPGPEPCTTGGKTMSYYLEHRANDHAEGDWVIAETIGHCMTTPNECGSYDRVCTNKMTSAAEKKKAESIATTVTEKKDLIFGEHYDEIVAKFQELYDRGRPTALDGVSIPPFP